MPLTEPPLSSFCPCHRITGPFPTELASWTFLSQMQLINSAMTGKGRGKGALALMRLINSVMRLINSVM